MRIVVTADPELPVPPVLYGGIERVVGSLVDGLVERGHEVALVAHPASRTGAALVPYSGQHSWRRSDTLWNAVTVARAYLAWRPHVIHSFGRLAYLAPLLPLRLPKVMSYQRPVTRSRVEWAHWVSRGSLRFTGCSHHLIEPVRDVGDWRVLYNSVPTDRFEFAAAVQPDAPLVFLGRIEAIKGTHLAIEVARRSGRQLVIAGTVADEHETYFREEIAPHVDGQAVVYVGPVDDAAKNEILSRAAALLMPVLWDEPFGIVMAEALACGTPVVGFARGAVPEVVHNGVTGFVCGSVDAMVEAVARSGALSREACRRTAEARFSVESLVSSCESMYESMQPRANVRVQPAGHPEGQSRPRG